MKNPHSMDRIPTFQIVYIDNYIHICKYICNHMLIYIHKSVYALVYIINYYMYKRIKVYFRFLLKRYAYIFSVSFGRRVSTS